MDKTSKKKIIVISILLHILLLLVWEAGLKLDLFRLYPLPDKIAANQPIIFDLKKPSLPKQVIETPDDSRIKKPPEKPDYLSDKNALARNEQTRPDLKQDQAYSKGDYDSKEFIEAQPVEKQTGEQADKKSEPADEENEIEDLKLTESALAEMEKQKLKESSRIISETLPRIKHNNRETQVSDTGGLSFNTYNWDFAPYMIKLKKRIQKNIYPPPAFSRYGMISGETLLRFKIYPDGKLKDLKVLDYKGHISLMQTSNTAIEISAPFPVLPPDFPEQFLEVTGKFVYIIQKK